MKWISRLLIFATGPIAFITFEEHYWKAIGLVAWCAILNLAGWLEGRWEHYERKGTLETYR